jgi:hypothetical protein
MTHKLFIQAYFIQVRTIQVNVVILVNKCRFQQMIVQHLFGGSDKINSLLTILYRRKYHVQYRILLVRMVTI